MRKAAESGNAVQLTASLSRISRHLGKLLQAVQYLLAHDIPTLTTNYLLRPHEIWVRRCELAAVDHEDPRSQPGVPHEACPVPTAPWRRRP